MGAFSEEGAFLSVDAYSRNIFNNVCFLFIEGALGFSVLRFWLFFRSVFGFCAKKLRFLGFGVHCGLRIFRFLEFGFRFSRKILMGFRIFIFDLFGFRFLFDLSGNYAPPLISNSTTRRRVSSFNKLILSTNAWRLFGKLCIQVLGLKG